MRKASRRPCALVSRPAAACSSPPARLTASSVWRIPRGLAPHPDSPSSPPPPPALRPATRTRSALNRWHAAADLSLQASAGALFAVVGTRLLLDGQPASAALAFLCVGTCLAACSTNAAPECVYVTPSVCEPAVRAAPPGWLCCCLHHLRSPWLVPAGLATAATWAMTHHRRLWSRHRELCLFALAAIHYTTFVGPVGEQWH